jgi:hypothetical protein
LQLMPVPALFKLADPAIVSGGLIDMHQLPSM